MQWQKTIERLRQALTALEVTDKKNMTIAHDQAFLQWQELATRTRHDRNTVYLIGNGASASMASHFAADLAKNGGLHTQVFSDLALITAMGNDIGYDHVFSEPLKRRMQPGDMLVAISSSGRSPNILRAVEQAEKCHGRVVTLSAMHPANPLRHAGMLNFYVPVDEYGEAETSHAAILHHWMDMVGQRFDETGS